MHKIYPTIKTHRYVQWFQEYAKNYGLLFLSGCLAALSQAPFNLVFLSIIGFSWFFYLVYTSKNINPFIAGHNFGFGYYLVNLSWIGNALLTDTSQFGIFLPVAYIGLPLALSLFYSFAIYLWHHIQKIIPNLCLKLILFGSLLGIFDAIRGSIFTGFPWNLPVYTTISILELAQPVYILGTYWYNVLWLILASSCALYFLYHHNKRYHILVCQTVVFSGLLIYGHIHMYGSPVAKASDSEIIRIIQPNIQQKLKWLPEQAQENFKTLLELSSYDLKKEKKYIFIWPETALQFHPEHDFSAASAILDILDNKHQIITGKMKFIEKPEKKGEFLFYNSIFQIISNGLVVPVYDKIHLVPFGEYLPLRFILEKIGFSQINFFKSEFSRGKNAEPFSISKNYNAGGIICYEAIFPSYANRLSQKGTNILINLTNDAWFGNSFGPYQHLVQTQFRAIENNIPIIRSANTGISAFISSHGDIINSIHLNKKGYIDIVLNNLKFNKK